MIRLSGYNSISNLKKPVSGRNHWGARVAAFQIFSWCRKGAHFMLCFTPANGNEGKENLCDKWPEEVGQLLISVGRNLTLVFINYIPAVFCKILAYFWLFSYSRQTKLGGTLKNGKKLLLITGAALQLWKCTCVQRLRPKNGHWSLQWYFDIHNIATPHSISIPSDKGAGRIFSREGK